MLDTVLHATETMNARQPLGRSNMRGTEEPVMTIRLAYAFAVSLFSCIALGGGREDNEIFITFVAPASLDELAAQADAIVRGRVLGSQAMAGKGKLPRVYTEHRFRIIETIGGFIPADPEQRHDEIQVLQHAGEVETESGIIRIADEVPLSSGSDYVLFLKWNPHYDKHEIWPGSYGIFKIENERVQAARNVRPVNTANGKGVRQLAEELRRIKRERERKQ